MHGREWATVCFFWSAVLTGTVSACLAGLWNGFLRLPSNFIC